LVKNGYDADSPISIAYFDNSFSALAPEIRKIELEEFITKGVDKEELLGI
jgi:hypothetical protein